MQKYFEIPKNDVQSKAENTWLENCQNNSIPFIILKSRTKLANVRWDYITYPLELYRIFDILDGKLRDKIIEIFHKYENSRSEYYISDSQVCFENIETPKAKLAAEELYDLIADYVERNGKSHHA